MIGFGGPTAEVEIRPFLNRVVEGKPISRERVELIVRHYEEVGGYSPYLRLTLGQAEALRKALEQVGLSIPVYVGMRNWHPTLDDTLARMARDGVRSAVGLVMAPHRSPVSWDRYLSAVDFACQKAHCTFQIRYAEPWHDHSFFIEAQRDRVEEAIRNRPAWDWNEAMCIFTAHSLPQIMADGSNYVSQITRSASLVADSLAIPHWSVAYQSRSGNPSDPWLVPDIRDAIPGARKAGFQTVVVVPTGFLCDHVEVLYDLDVEGRKIAEAQGLNYIRPGTVGDHPRFIQMLVELIRRASGSG
jgi:ferrochelatase